MTLKTQLPKPAEERGPLSRAREGYSRRMNRGNEKNGGEEGGRHRKKGMEEG